MKGTNLTNAPSRSRFAGRRTATASCDEGATPRIPIIIAYGNPLRQDDGIGWRAAELLEGQLAAGSAEIIQCRQLTPELAPRLADSPLAIFLDAAANKAPGTVHHREVVEAGMSAWSHQLTPEQLLTLTRQLSGRMPRAVIFTGGVERMDFGAELTQRGKACATGIADAVAGFLAAFAGTRNSTAQYEL